MSKEKEDVSSVIDADTQRLAKAGYQPSKSKPATGDKLIGQLERFAKSTAKGGGTSTV